ncbi:ABC transporter substrate-binding protein [Paenibacillus sp. YAF4_2]|uniref:ABC transporter substrate-binding protein n=1 Tax=Paenibacillus sp. YAF4_2 TaxID=3233085 RepID=UPI003F970E45
MGVKVNKPLLTSMAIALALTLTATACSNGNNGGNNSSNASTAPSNAATNSENTSSPEATDEALKPIEISAFIGAPGQAPTPDNKLFKTIKDELGITFKQEFLVGDLEQKLGVMIAGGDYPDLITANPKLVTSGAVIPLEDLIEQYAPKLKEHYAKYWNQMKDPSDGHIYWLPNYGAFQGEVNETWYSGPAFYIQKAVLKEFGYPKLQTLDDYMKLIRDYAAKYPEIDGQPTIGFSTLASDWRTFGLLNAPEHLTGHPNDGGVVVDNGVASVFADKDISKTYYKELNNLYNEGLMDKEAFTQNYDQYLAKLTTGRVLGMFDQHWNFQTAEDSLNTQNKSERTYVGFPLVYDASTKDYYRDRAPINLNNGFGISVDAKDPTRIIQALEALMDERYQKMFTWGEEGVDYSVGADGKFTRTPEQRTQYDDPAWKLANLGNGIFTYLPKLEGTLSDGNATTPGGDPQEFYDSLKDVDKEVLSAYGHKTWTEFFSSPPDNPIYYPAWQIDLIDGSDASIANKKMTDASLKFLPRAIMSKPDQFDKVWQDYVDEYKKINVKAYEDRINEQIQWRIQNWSTK